jgi:hypothetical protein
LAEESLQPPTAPFPDLLQVTVAGMPYFGSVGVAPLSMSRHGKTRQAGTSLISQTTTAVSVAMRKSLRPAGGSRASPSDL